jgi:pilus assembly protein CpaB
MGARFAREEIMNLRRLLVALLVALVLAGGVTFVVSRKLMGRAAPAANVQHYVAAARALQPGEVLKPEDLTLVEWPGAKALAGAFTKTADVVGRALVYPIASSARFCRSIWLRPGRSSG